MSNCISKVDSKVISDIDVENNLEEFLENWIQVF